MVWWRKELLRETVLTLIMIHIHEEVVSVLLYKYKNCLTVRPPWTLSLFVLSEFLGFGILVRGQLRSQTAVPQFQILVTLINQPKQEMKVDEDQYISYDSSWIWDKNLKRKREWPYCSAIHSVCHFFVLVLHHPPSQRFIMLYGGWWVWG